MAPRKEKGEYVCASGHATGYFAGVAVKDLKGPDKHNVVLGLSILAKLNPKCHMNYLDYL